MSLLKFSLVSLYPCAHYFYKVFRRKQPNEDVDFFFQDSSEVSALQDKLSQSNNKLAEFRNQCEKLKKDLKVAHKVLLKHVTAIYILLQC